MKKILKSLGIAIGLPIFYNIVTNIVAILLLLGYAALSYYTVSTTKFNVAPYTPNPYIVTLIGAITTFLLLVLIYSKTKENLFKRCKFKEFNRKYIINIIILVLGLSFIISFIVGILSFIFPSYLEVSQTINNAYNSMWAVVAITIFLPMFEEILFRGLIFNTLKSSMNFKIALIVQAAIFGIAHGNILQSLYAFILGIILNLIYIATDSIWGSIIAHILFNILGSSVVPLLFGLYPNLVIAYFALGFVLTIIGSYLMIKTFKYSQITSK